LKLVGFATGAVLHLYVAWLIWHKPHSTVPGAERISFDASPGEGEGAGSKVTSTTGASGLDMGLVRSERTFIALGVLVGFVGPFRIVLLYMTIWGFWTATLRPLAGEPIWEFIERVPNWAIPLAFLCLRGWPRSRREWFS